MIGKTVRVEGFAKRLGEYPIGSQKILEAQVVKRWSGSAERRLWW